MMILYIYCESEGDMGIYSPRKNHISPGNVQGMQLILLRNPGSAHFDVAELAFMVETSSY